MSQGPPEPPPDKKRKLFAKHNLYNFARDHTQTLQQFPLAYPKPFHTTEAILLRAAKRNHDFFLQEVVQTALACRLPTHYITHCGQGLLLLDNSHGKSPDHAKAMQNFRKCLPYLSGVRRHIEVIESYKDATQMLKTLRPGFTRFRQHDKFTISCEQLTQSSNYRLLPWVGLNSASAISIALRDAIGQGYVACIEQDSLGSLDEFVALEGKQGAVHIGINIPLFRQRSSLQLNETTLHNVPRWILEWETRPFGFSSSLDSLHAVGAINFALLAHCRLHRSSAVAGLLAPSTPLWIHDPCCGSGTILAAAAAAGHYCTGSDISTEFVQKAAGNLTGIALDHGLQMFQHDATSPFPKIEDGRWMLEQDSVNHASKSGKKGPDLIVCNPPWGKHIGTRSIGQTILENVVKEFTGAVMCWIANPETVDFAISLPNLTVVCLAPVGTAYVLVVHNKQSHGLDSTN